MGHKGILKTGCKGSDFQGGKPLFEEVERVVGED